MLVRFGIQSERFAILLDRFAAEPFHLSGTYTESISPELCSL